jgi:hypothetical protein
MGQLNYDPHVILSKRRFRVVYVCGMFGFGGAMFLLMTFIRYFHHPARAWSSAEIVPLAVSLFIYLFFGYLWGILMWSFLKSK